MNMLFKFCRISVGCLGMIAISIQLLSGLQKPDFSILNFFSYFTILSNLLFSVLLIITSLSRNMLLHLTTVRGAATLYMSVTGLVYFILLRGLEESLQTTIPWINTLLHYVFPSVAVLDWFLVSPYRTLNKNVPLLWIAFPILYLLYSLIRGPFTNFYPYPFLNIEKQGSIFVIITCSIILVLFILLGFVLKIVYNRIASSTKTL